MKMSNIGIRSAFRISILVLVALAFLAFVTISFTHVTDSELSKATASIRSEVNYLCLQIESLEQRSAAFEEIIAASGADPEELEAENPDSYHAFSDPMEDLLEGYTLAETGTVAILVDDTVIATDDERLAIGGNAKELLGDKTYSAIDASIQSEELQPVTFDGALANPDSAAAQNAYLLAGKQDGRTVVIIESSQMVFRDRNAIIAREAMVSLIILIIVFLVVDRLLSLMVARRIDKMNEALGRITAGDLNARVEDKGTREFKSLSKQINETVEALKGWIAEAETRMDAELTTAKTIQESALPCTFPPFPDIQRFDIYASMKTARHVGGDFYDFFLVGDECDDESGKLAFVIADVSGKGVPAALFMMKAKALIRNYVEAGLELGEAVTEANRQICSGNDASMFVTAWVGVLDYGTGHVSYVNAGHNPPLLWNRSEGWHWMRERSGPVLGLFEAAYEAYSIDCQTGDTFLLYTDGVTEAFSTTEELYGEERLLAVAKENYRLHPRALIEAVRNDVAAHAQGAEQSDDITILALEIGVPPEVTATLEVPAYDNELGRVNEFLHSELDRRFCPKRVQNQLDIAVEELFVNVCHYAYPDSTAEEQKRVLIQRTYSAEPASITVEIIDFGAPFDPLAKPEVVMPEDIMDVSIGGLGILMAKKSVDEMSYERIDGMNVVTLVKRW